MRSVRRVRRVLRKIDPWTVFKFAVVFNAIAALVFVLGSWVMWSIALQRGIPEGIADIFESLTLTFTPDGELYFRALVLLSIVWWVVATAAMTLGSVIYNLISDVVGGIEYDVLEETFQQPPQRRRVPPQAPARPFPGALTPSTPAPSRTGRESMGPPPTTSKPERVPEPVAADATAATEMAPRPKR